MSLLVINAEQVRELLPMHECVEVMAQAMSAASAGRVEVPPRRFVPVAGDRASLGMMPGSDASLGSYGAKLISLHRDNPARGLPAIQGFVALFDGDGGMPVAIIEGAEITGIRTAAASGLATRLLARAGADSCGIFGTGVQAQTHIDAVAAVRPLRRVLVWPMRPPGGRSAAASTAPRCRKRCAF